MAWWRAQFGASRVARAWRRIVVVGVVVLGVGLLLGIPWWVAAAIALVPVGFLASLVSWQVRLNRLMYARRCPFCGYDLRASRDRCPECGKIYIEFSPGDGPAPEDALRPTSDNVGAS